jgi:hypothetical protein
MSLTKARKRNLGGTLDDITQTNLVELASLTIHEQQGDVIWGVGVAMFQVCLDCAELWNGIRYRECATAAADLFADILDQIEDGQNDEREDTALGALNPFPRIQAAEIVKLCPD